MRIRPYRSLLLSCCLALAAPVTFAAPLSPAPPSAAAKLADHLERVERQAERLERQIAHPQGRPEAAAELAALRGHLERLQHETAGLADATLEARRAELLERLRSDDRHRGGQVASPLAATGVIQGTITGPGGQPLGGIHVEVHLVGGGFVSLVSSGPGGVYRILGLADGSYLVATYLYTGTSPYLNETYDDVLCESYGPCHPEAATPVTIAGGATVAGIDFQLSLGGKLHGRVLDDDGTPVAGAFVEARTEDGRIQQAALTDVVGRFTIDGLFPASYVLYAASHHYLDELYPDVPCEGGECPLAGAAVIPVAIGSQVTGLDFHLKRRGALRGRVLEAGNLEPIPYADVNLRNTDGTVTRKLTADSLGDWESSDLPAGVYYASAFEFEFEGQLYDGIPCPGGGFCSPTAGTPIALAESGAVDGIDFALTRLGAVSGTVRAAETLHFLSGSVHVYDSRGLFVDSVPGAEYRADSLAAGSYFLRTEVAPWYGQYADELWQDLPCEHGCEPTDGTPVTVALGATTTGIDFRLERFGRLAGVVRDQATAQPLRGIDVEIINAVTFISTTRRTDEEGRFEFDGLPDGSYFAAANTGTIRNGHYLGEIFSGFDCHQCPPPASGTAIAVSFDTPHLDVDFTLREGGFISGTVTPASGPPAQGVVVAIDGSGDLAGYAYFASDGLYEIGGLPAGSYYLKATSEAAELAAEIWPNLLCPEVPACDPTAGTPVAVTVGARTIANFALDTLGRLRGRLVDAESGSPAAGGSVRLYTEAGLEVKDAWVDPAGKYVFPGVYPGSYKLATYETYSYVDRVYGGSACDSGSCDPGTGSSLAVALGQTTTAADLPLAFGPGIAGWVRREGSAAGAVGIDVWTADGELFRTLASASSGRFRVAIPSAAAYYLSTDGGPGFIDEVYSGVACPNGPAYLGLCDPLEGTPVAPVLGQPAVDGVVFDLESRSSLFRDGFESGGFGAWSLILGIPGG